MKKNTPEITNAARQHEFLVMRRRLCFQLVCEDCGGEEEFVSLDDAVLFSGFATREIVRLSETGGLHYLETGGGHLFICRKSLDGICTICGGKQTKCNCRQPQQSENKF